VLVTKPWSSQGWVYYNNTLTLALCIFGVVAGLLRWTPRYELIQIIGLFIKILGMGILLDGDRATINTASMVITLVFIGAGGAMSVIGSRVRPQLSVPHQDFALAISLLSSWSKIGGSIGSAIVAVIWAEQMPKTLREYLPPKSIENDIKTIFGSVTSIKTKYAANHPMRLGAV
jgi:hypothetical protein